MNNKVTIYKTTFPNGKHHYGLRTTHIKPVKYKLESIKVAKLHPDYPQNINYWLNYEDVDIVSTVYNIDMTRDEAQQFIDKQVKDKNCINKIVGRDGGYKSKPISIPAQYYKKLISLRDETVSHYVHAEYIKMKPDVFVNKVDMSNKCGAHWVNIKNNPTLLIHII